MILITFTKDVFMNVCGLIVCFSLLLSFVLSGVLQKKGHICIKALPEVGCNANISHTVYSIATSEILGSMTQVPFCACVLGQGQ